MLSEIMVHLASAGVTVQTSTRKTKRAGPPQLTVSEGNRKWAFAAGARRRAPYPGELPTLRDTHKMLAKAGLPLLYAPYVSVTLGNALIADGWSWVDARGNFDLKAKGLRLRQRIAHSPLQRTRGGLPLGKGSLAVVRSLIIEEHRPIDRRRLRETAGVSAGRVSQILGRFESLGLVRREGREARLEDRKALVETFLNEYPGPRGMEQRLYSLDPPSAVAMAVIDWSNSQAAQVRISADTGPDLLAPWRRPSTLVVYGDTLPNLEELSLVAARGREDANVLWRIPDDETVFHHPLTAKFKGSMLVLADALQMLWDLHDLGGSDRVEAAEKLQSWLLRDR